MSQHSVDQAGGATSPPAAGGGVDMQTTLTVGGILTVSSILMLFVIFACGISSLQFCLNSLDRRRAALESSPSGRRRRRRAEAAAGNNTRGVDPELLRSLPVTLYRGAAAEGKDSSSVECAVCLAELEDGEAARFLPRCGHGFHAECVDMWLASHTTCPLCRLTVAKPVPDMPPMAPVPHESANYAYASNNLPANVLFGAVSDSQGAATAAAPSSTLVIEIPESAACDAAPKSPGSASARLMSIRRLWSFGRQGTAAGPSSSSCSCSGGSQRADVEQGVGVAIAIGVAEAHLPSSEAAPSASATRGAAA